MTSELQNLKRLSENELQMSAFSIRRPLISILKFNYTLNATKAAQMLSKMLSNDQSESRHIAICVALQPIIVSRYFFHGQHSLLIATE